MADRASGRVPDPLPRPTPRRLLIRSLGTLAVFAALVTGGIVAFDQADQPADVEDLIEQPRTVSYGRLSLQIPSSWRLNQLDDCGHVQDDTLILGNAGVTTCQEGERDEEASDVVMSSLEGPLQAPAPAVVTQPITLPSGLQGEIGTAAAEPTDPAAGRETPEPDDDQLPLITTVLELPSVDVQVVATSRDRELVSRIVRSAKPVPSDSDATRTVSYLSAAIDVPPDWNVNDIRCGVPLSDTVTLGHPGKPRLTDVAGEPCPSDRGADVSAITLDSLDSEFGQRWVVQASDRVELLDGLYAVRGVKQLPDGLTVTVVAVPTLDAIAVARSANQALVDKVLSTIHQAVPTPPEEQPETTPSPAEPDPSPPPTLPAGIETRKVTARGISVFVPTSWTTGDQRCGTPLSDTVLLEPPPATVPQCVVPRPPDVSSVTFARLYGPYGSLWQAAATDPITLASGLSGLRGSFVGDDGVPVSVLAFPSLDVILVATASAEGAEAELVEAILATARRAADGAGRAG